MHIVMAMELGLNPRNFGSMSANPHEKWKTPLPDFIEEIYFKRFKRDKPALVRSFEEMARPKVEKKAQAKLARANKAAAVDSTEGANEPGLDPYCD